MNCEHKHLRCTNGEFYCMDCGARVDAPKPKATEDEKPKAAEPEKPKRKTTRKGATKA